MTLERVVIRGIGAADETYRTKQTYTPDQVAELREMALMIYKAAWQEAQHDVAKIGATRVAGGEAVSASDRITIGEDRGIVSWVMSKFRRSAIGRQSSKSS